jgi:hypothetical protein
MDFTWVAQDDSNAIQNAIVDAKGDLIAATANDTPARLAVGNNGETLVADSSTSTGLRYQGNFAAGKNKIINGDFGIWQRGTSFTGFSIYTADRWFHTYDNNPTSATVSRQTFTPGTAPVAGYEGQYFLRMGVTTAGTATSQFLYQKVEDVRTFAGQTVTYSFWAKADSARTVGVYSYQNFGSGGSADVSGSTTNFSVTTSWQRFSTTVAVASLAGKTIGTNSFFSFVMTMPAANGVAIDFWGVQMEASNTATAFQTATGTIQGELAACQRYYQRYTSESAYGYLGFVAGAYTTVNTYAYRQALVKMRVAPTSVDSGGNLRLVTASDVGTAITGITIGGNNNSSSPTLNVQVASGLTSNTYYNVQGNNDTTAYVGVSAEL